MSEEIKRIDASEFRKLGYLQELNRQFLHPLGLALEIKQDENGDETLGGVWDSRDDLEGIRFAYLDPDLSDGERLRAAREKAKFVKDEQAKRNDKRVEALGYWIEPLE